MPKPLSLENQIGKTYGKLVVVGVIQEKKYTLRCLCECGNFKSATIYNLKGGRVKSCGCLRKDLMREYPFKKTHGLAYTPEYKMWQTSKRRALEKGLEFDLDPEDIRIPDRCPVLGIALRKGKADKKITDDSPSIDRFDNTKGYTKDNIRVISMKANRIKGTATVEDIEAVLKYMTGELNASVCK